MMLNSFKNKKTLRVVIVDDSVLIRQMLEKVINDVPDMEVVGAAGDAHEARQVIKDTNPDVITLDVEMPKMSGIDFLEKIMTLRPMPVVMVSTLTQKGGQITLKALEIGAIDYVAKPAKMAHSDDLMGIFQKELIPKLNAARFANVKNTRLNVQPQSMPPATKKSFYDIIGVAASTGGIERLRAIFSSISVHLPPVMIVQHINERYVENMVDRFKAIIPSHLDVTIAKDNIPLHPNTIYFADNHHHLRLKMINDQPYSYLTDEAPLNGFKASADYLFQTISEAPLKNPMGLIVSGMGNDGAAGLAKMRSKGMDTIGESEESCLVYGMPKAAKDKGALKYDLNIADIIRFINKKAG